MKNFYIFSKLVLFTVGFFLTMNATSQILEIISGDIITDPDSSVMVTATVTDTSGEAITDAKIQWNTEPGYLGKVTKEGWLIPNHPGEGYLIAKYKDYRDSVMLTVNGTPKNDDDDDMGDMEDEYPKVKIVPSSIRVEISDSVELRAFYIDSMGYKIDTTFTWSVEPMEIGMFPDSSVSMFYSADTAGSGIIIATLGELADTAKISVYETREKREKIKKEKEKENNKGKQLTIEPGDMMVYTGNEPIQYSAMYKTNGNKHQGAEFMWSVTDTTVASIDENGLLTLTGETGMTLVEAAYSSFEAAVELLVVDSTVDMDVNTISIRRVLPNGNELHPKYFKEGESYKIGGLPYPLNILNAGMLHFPYGCISEDVDIFMFIPEKYAEMDDDSTEVSFTEDIITGVKFSVVPSGSDTIVEPYYFNIPVELKLVYKQDLLDSLGVDPADLDVFFADNTGFVDVNGGVAMVDTARHRIYASIEHFSTIVVKEAKATTQVEDLEPEDDNYFNVYPNPFSAATNIEFYLDQNSDVQLMIYNMFGQQVKVLVDGELPKGKHKVRWSGNLQSGSQATTGIYLCRFIKNGEVSNVKRLIINR
ncbi:T9SS type A sorting domain-containing protein [Maribellus sediminis]|uniref:T9SS type A sorting domain-containing protein n=1 Tax=Maribellus sediminis TaxID=2696285 RepID=UPI0014303A3C|nr:T9SS type A sorting domain-containing protein [Maribellus sediminis]